ncbi:MAG TPA: hypothetical protein VG892_04135 [Terriglobales bacterium]|nr:hypothetical protein [Terriglobales bacterium]
MFLRGRILWLPVSFLFSFLLLAGQAPAQTDIAGQWSRSYHDDYPERGDIYIGDYVNLPINDAGRMRADTWSAEKWAMIEHQCHPHAGDYGPRGTSGMRIWADVDPVTQGVLAWHNTLAYMLPERTIYMDKRPHPSEWAPHTWTGFSTGEWEGDMLMVETTHMKEGYFRRNGVSRSEKGSMTEYFIRNHNVLTLFTVIEDPVYLTEPMIWTSDWVLDTGHQLSPNFCVYSLQIDQPKSWVAFHLPGENRWLKEYAEKIGIPYEAARGGAETMYPEYQKKLAGMPIPPPRKKEE